MSEYEFEITMGKWNATDATDDTDEDEDEIILSNKWISVKERVFSLKKNNLVNWMAAWLEKNETRNSP